MPAVPLKDEGEINSNKNETSSNVSKDKLLDLLFFILATNSSSLNSSLRGNADTANLASSSLFLL